MQLINRQQAPEILGVTKSYFGNVWEAGAAYGRPQMRECKRKTAYYCQQDMIDWFARFKARPVNQPYVERFNPHFDNAMAFKFLTPPRVKRENWGELAKHYTVKTTKTVKCRVLDEYTPNARLDNVAPQHYFEAY